MYLFPLILLDLCSLSTFFLHFSSPCHRRHPRMSKNIIKDTKAIGRQTNSYFQISSNILRCTAKQVGGLSLGFQASSSRATSENIQEYYRRYKDYWKTNKLLFSDILRYSKIYREAGRRTSPCGLGLLVAGDIREYLRIFQKK